MAKSKVRVVLSNLTKGLSEENYNESLAQYRLWLDIGIAHGHVSDDDQLTDDVLQIMQPDLPKRDQGEIIHPAVHLFSRFVKDIGTDGTSAQFLGLRRSCTETLKAFFEENLSYVLWNRQIEAEGEGGWGRYSLMAMEFPDELAKGAVEFLIKTNLIACWVNLGYVKRTVIRNHILQSLFTDPKLHGHQADALIILFKVAGATLGAYADPLVVDRCFEALKRRYFRNTPRGGLLQVRVRCEERLLG